MIRSKWFMGGVVTCLLSLAALTAATSLRADDPSPAERAQKAADTLQQFESVPAHSIPETLLHKAQAIAVIPHVVKAAFGIGGSYGKGVVSQRKKGGGWTPPAYITLQQGSYGFQIGAEATDFVIVFTNEEGFKPLLSGKVQLGASGSVAAGPVGRNAGASTGVQFKSAVYTYSRSKGAFVGVSLEGAVVTIDDSADHQVYGDHVSATDILVKQNVKARPAVQPFINALDKYTQVALVK